MMADLFTNAHKTPRVFLQFISFACFVEKYNQDSSKEHKKKSSVNEPNKGLKGLFIRNQLLDTDATTKAATYWTQTKNN